MHIIRNRAVVRDRWQHLPDDAPVRICADEEGIIVSFERWQKDRQALRGLGARLGLRLGSTDALESIAEDLHCFEVIALQFGSFTDGRGYSQARLLRERYRYKGEIRALGDFLQDQLFFLERCGVDAFEISADQNIEPMLQAFGEISTTYQPAADTGELIFSRRRRSVSDLKD